MKTVDRSMNRTLKLPAQPRPESITGTADKHLKALLDAVPGGLAEVTFGYQCPWCHEDGQERYDRDGNISTIVPIHADDCPYVKAKRYLHRRGIEVARFEYTP